MASDVYYQSRTPEIYGGTIALIVAATIFVLLRLYARQISPAPYWWEDWTIVIALILDYGFSICFWIEIKYAGLGRHTIAYGGPVDEHELFIFFKLFLAIQILYFASAVAIKTSLILLYYRIFGVVRWFRWTLAVAWSIVILYFIVDVLAAVFECRPVSFYWNKTIKGGTCVNQIQFYRWNGVANLLIDFMILSLTIPMVWRLNLAWRQKLSLSGIFLLGTFACVASIVRVIYFDQLTADDVAYTIVPASIWTTIEQSLGIICACLPTLRPLFGHLFANIKGSSNESKNKDHPLPGGIGLSYVNSRPMLRPSVEASMAGFGRLDEESLSGALPVTTYVGRCPKDDLKVIPNVIVKNQRIEQRHDLRGI